MTRIVALCLVVACKREASPAPPVVTPKPIDAAPLIDAPVDATELDAPPLDAPPPLDAGAPGGLKGTIMAKATTPANSPPTPVAGCIIGIVDEATKQARTTKTDAKGNYRIELPAGRYALEFASCLRGALDCSNIERKPVTHAEIDGNWQTVSFTSHSCNKCLDASVQIATPDGAVPVTRLRIGDAIFVVHDGRRVVASVRAVQRIAAPPHATARRLVLADGRVLVGSAPHPLADGRLLGAIQPGDLVDGAQVIRVDAAPYTDGHAYDLLPSIDGAYIADGVPLRSTM